MRRGERFPLPNALAILVILAVLACAGCAPREARHEVTAPAETVSPTPAPAPVQDKPRPHVQAAIQGPIPPGIAAVSKGRNLRIRSLPSTDATVLALLGVDDQVTVGARTSWEDSIDGISAPWYEVSKGWTAGWCFGGYLQIPETSIIPESGIKADATIPTHSYFGSATGASVGPLPSLDMKIFGMELPVQLPSLDGFVATFDPNNCIVAFELPSPVEGTLKVTAVDPSGGAYSRDLAENEPGGYRVYTANEEGHVYKKRVIGFAFRPPASAHAGTWRFTVVRSPGLRKVYELTLQTTAATVSSGERPDPFSYPNTVSAHQGDELSLYGAKAPASGKLVVALYYITDVQNPDLSFVLLPRVAGELTADHAGRYQTTVTIGSDMVSGAYKLATGTETMEINLFDVYIDIE